MDSSKTTMYLWENDWTTDNLTNNKWLFNCDKILTDQNAPMTLRVFIANNIIMASLTDEN